jgi:tRNA dimethylallyltransferase
MMATGSQTALPNPRTHIIVLVGPTAVGKTEMAIQLAERLKGEIVSVDSRLFYRGMDIGTAKPDPVDRARVPHHLIDIVEPNQTISLAEFQGLAHEAISGIVGRRRVPLLVGGTGQYIRAVTAGWSPPRVPPHGALRAELMRLAAERGNPWLHGRLQSLDRESAALIDARNTRRMVRALEVILSSGRRFSEQRLKGQPRYRTTIIGLRRPRAELYARIDARIESMWQQGLLEETRLLLERGCEKSLPAMSAIGYSQCVAVIEGTLKPADAKVEMRRLTRAFVRRQANWFKETDPAIIWFDAGATGVVGAITAMVMQKLDFGP